MIGEKVSKQLERDAVAYKAGFADGYRVAKAEQIHCKDCKYCRTYYHGENMPFSYACDKLYLTNNLSSDDYCSRGVKKEE